MNKLTDRQLLLWLDDEVHAGVPINNVLLRHEIFGEVDVVCFTQVFSQLCAEQAVFKQGVTKLPNGDRVFSSLETTLPLEFVDFSGLDDEYLDWQQTWCQQLFSYDMPLYRAALVKLADQNFFFYLNQHHSITDGFSCLLIQDLLSQFYLGDACVQDAAVEQLPAILGEEKNQENKVYWESRYKKPVEPVSFYGQSTHLKQASTLRLSQALDAETVALLQAQPHSLSTFFSSVLFSFLHRISLNQDLSIGVPLLNRGDGFSGSLGLLMEVIPYRISISGQDAFTDVLKKVTGEVSTVEVNFSDFVSSRKAGYETVLNIYSDISNSFCGMPAKCEVTTPLNVLQDLGDLPGDTWVGRESLAVQVFHLSTGGCQLSFDFNLGVWRDASTRQRAVEHFCLLLKECLLNPEQKISEIDILTTDEKGLLLSVESRDNQREEKRPTIISLFKKQVALHADKAAIQFNEESLSYSELDQQITSLANQLSSLGVSTNVLVGVCVDRSPQMIVAIFAIVQAGGVYVPIDPKQPEDRISLILEDANPLITLTEKALKHKLGGTDPLSIICLDDNSSSVEDDVVLPDSMAVPDIAYITFTSGSTGRPKGVEVLHSGLLTLLLSVTESPGITSADTLLAVSTISFDIAAVDIFLPLVNGATVRIAPYESTINGDKLRALIDKEEITFFQATPASYRLLIGSGWEGRASLRIISTGEALPFELAQALLTRCGSLWNMYGPTETTIWSSAHQVQSGESFISIGKAIEGTQLYVLDAMLKPTPIGVAGGLYIAGDGLAKGYYENQVMTDEKFVANPFSSLPDAKMYKTGDLVRLLPDLCLAYLGRIDFQVKIRGFRIELGEIETILGQHEFIKQCVVTTWPDSSGEQSLIAYIVPALDVSTLEGAAIRDYLKSKLPGYMVPAKFVVLDAFPLTPNGKVDRKSLPAPDESVLVLQTSEYKAPSNDFELSLSVVWQKLLKLERVGVTDNFFDLGGDSLMTVLLVHEMELASGIKFDIGGVFSHPTIEQLVNLKQSGEQKASSSIVPLQEKGEGLPLFCVCGINIYQELADSLGTSQPVYGIYVAEEQAFMNAVMAGKKSDLSVVHLAQLYCDAILRRQPEGPYQLAGISFGGLLAIETARLLKDQEQEVSLVILLDTILPSGIQRNVYSQFKEGVKGQLAKIKKRYKLSGNKEQLAEMANLREKAYRQAMEAYSIAGEYYDGQVVLIKAKEQHWGKGVVLKGDYGWGDVVSSEIVVHEMVGDHLGIIKQPNVLQLAKQLKDYLQ